MLLVLDRTEGIAGTAPAMFSAATIFDATRKMSSTTERIASEEDKMLNVVNTNGLTTSKTNRLTKRIVSSVNKKFPAAAKMDASAENMFGVTRNISKVKKNIVITAQNIGNETKNIFNAA